VTRHPKFARQSRQGAFATTEAKPPPHATTTPILSTRFRSHRLENSFERRVVEAGLSVQCRVQRPDFYRYPEKMGASPSRISSSTRPRFLIASRVKKANALWLWHTAPGHR
jgi:hypothetical protein